MQYPQALTNTHINLYSDVSSGDFPHVEAHCWDHILIELTTLSVYVAGKGVESQ